MTGTVRELWRWPVAGMGGEAMPSVRLDTRGVGGDRVHAVLREGSAEPLRTPEGRAACGIEDGEKVLGLLHLGRPKGAKPAPERAPIDEIREFLD